MYIDSIVAEKSLESTNGIVAHSGSETPLVPAEAIVVRYVAFEVPYLRSLPDEISLCSDGKRCCMTVLAKEQYLRILWYSKIT